MTDIDISADERIDDTGFGGFRIIQGSGFSYGVDSVLLSAFVSGETGARPPKAIGRTDAMNIADLGTGNGIIPIILAHKIDGAVITGIEIDEDACKRAERSICFNGLELKIKIINGDVKSIKPAEGSAIGTGTSNLIDKSSLVIGSFDAVVTNPPYFRKGAGITNLESAKARARHEITASLRDFLDAAYMLLREGGDFYIVHRTDRLADVICEMRNSQIEPKQLQPIKPRPESPANLVLIRGVKGGGSGMDMLNDIIVREANDEYSAEIEKIYERI